MAGVGACGGHYCRRTVRPADRRGQGVVKEEGNQGSGLPAWGVAQAGARMLNAFVPQATGMQQHGQP